MRQCRSIIIPSLWCTSLSGKKSAIHSASIKLSRKPKTDCSMLTLGFFLKIAPGLDQHDLTRMMIQSGSTSKSAAQMNHRETVNECSDVAPLCCWENGRLCFPWRNRLVDRLLEQEFSLSPQCYVLFAIFALFQVLIATTFPVRQIL